MSRFYDFDALDAGQVSESDVFTITTELLSKRSHGQSLAFFSTRVSPSGSNDEEHDDSVAIQLVMANQYFSGTKEEFANCLSFMSVQSVVEATVRPGKSRRGEPSLFCTDAKLLRCSPHPETIMLILEAVDSGSLSRDKACAVLRCTNQELGNMLICLGKEALQSDLKRLLNIQARVLHDLPADHTRIRKTRLSAAQFKVVEEARECCASVPLQHSDEAAALPNEILDAIQSHLPNGLSDEEKNRRIEYLQRKKIRQISWFVAHLKSTIDKIAGAKGSKALAIWDVGGGRGDLAAAVAWVFPECSVRVLDIQQSSLRAGQLVSRTLGLTNIVFEHADFLQKLKASDCSKTESCEIADAPDLVIALHACGGLSDAILAYVATHPAASCLICTCCFTKNVDLAFRAWDRVNMPQGHWRSVAPSTDFCSEVCRIAESVSCESESQLAMHCCNTFRLRGVHLVSQASVWNRASSLSELLTFPLTYSAKNQVIRILRIQSSCT
eukprot:ANDGO_00194.mRNA.1 hypothetical protein